MGLNVEKYDNLVEYGSLHHYNYVQLKKLVDDDIHDNNLVILVNLDAVINYVHQEYSNLFVNGFLINVKDLPHIIKIGHTYYDDVLRKY